MYITACKYNAAITTTEYAPQASKMAGSKKCMFMLALYIELRPANDRKKADVQVCVHDLMSLLRYIVLISAAFILTRPKHLDYHVQQRPLDWIRIKESCPYGIKRGVADQKHLSDVLKHPVTGPSVSLDRTIRHH